MFDILSIEKWSLSLLTLSLDATKTLLQPWECSGSDGTQLLKLAHKRPRSFCLPGSWEKAICHVRSLTTLRPSCQRGHMQVFRSIASTVTPAAVGNPHRPCVCAVLNFQTKQAFYDHNLRQHLTATTRETPSKNVVVEPFPNSWSTSFWAK